MAYVKAGDLQSGRRYLAEAVQFDGRYFRSRLGLGYVLLEQGRATEANRELEESMKLLPTLQGGFLLAQSYEKSGEQARAVELYQAVAEADPSGRLGQAAGERLRLLEGR
jgi:tetratricopeptide (TPR) repeat protein